MLAQFIIGKKKIIMVTELNGVPFGLKLYMWFRNQTSVQRKFHFEIKSMISDQNCKTWSLIAALLDPFWNHTI